MFEYPIGDDSSQWEYQALSLIQRAEAGDAGAATSLLDWFQDQHWLGFPEARKYLVENVEVVMPKLIEMLSGDDDYLKASLISGLVADLPDHAVIELKSPLINIAETAEAEEADIEASLVLCERDMVTREKKRRLLQLMKNRYEPSNISLVHLIDALEEPPN